jgi:bifunctional non-homologous end joining protein LigD
MGLKSYRKKRNFRGTPEPRGKIVKTDHRRFVVQEHHASQLHFDFRLEIEGVLKSWSVPKGPSLDPRKKRLAVTTEDHPVEYLKFEGHIAKGNYGAGEVRIWDAGTYEIAPGEKNDKGSNASRAIRKGKLSVILKGNKLRGEFNLIRMKNRARQWLLIKGKDEFSEAGWKLKTILAPKDLKIKSFAKKFQKKPGKRDGKTSKRSRKKSLPRNATINERAVSAVRFFKDKKLRGDANIKIKNDILSLTNLDKVYWPAHGYTKGDLIKYYYEVFPHILPYLKDRPLILKRFPEGINKDFFYQHDIDDAPDYIHTSRVKVGEGHQVDYIIGGTLATLLYTTNLGAIEQHPWHSRSRSLDNPDWIVFDLDPGERVSFSTICVVALSVKETLKQLALTCYAKTSGSRGIHIYVPIKPDYDYAQVAQLAKQVAEIVAGNQPEIATTERSLKKRKRGQVYIDHLQNNRGKSIVAPYSVRPMDGATVSTPLEWGEIKRRKVSPRNFTIKNIMKRIESKGDIYASVLSDRQSLGQAMKRLGKRKKNVK